MACVVNRNGDTIFSHASGRIAADKPEPMTFDQVFVLASTTKLVTAIACMQLVEKGNLALDDADQVEGFFPYLNEVKILTGFDEEGKPKLVKKKNRITLRMLLCNTA